MTVKSSISLTDQQAAFARSLVDKGRHSSVSAVVQQGLDLLQQKTEAEESDQEALRLLLRQRQEGSFISSTEMKSRLSTLLDEKRRSHDVAD
ncbi:transcriptional regulators containing the CopG/Arc/MetJ DNA-binding domain protein [Kiloniella spongiae]|uniref:Transcriptional regulators containing the CopG/Arc/MetJ DNA-binding domain protein n=1 Tax=Kiloniella spongiae TaxID=1489064 RepID=A0A0H2MEZ9_9PROT|nr:type II toxin-antitoxin system ParD family antitoxin [Kiloniella spongiae]KLN60801.1 transcriptional regulators containing the CopG/Arc/MetJ DNA-binding domain protein [Kiloniella spongiae]